MRRPEYISPSGLKKFLDADEQYYLHYLSDNRPVRSSQTQPMAIGSAFDAMVKSHLFEKIFGKGHARWPVYEKRAIFEAQVERQWWDWGWDHGQWVFDRYKECGALADLMIEMGKAASDPHFEVEIRGTIDARMGKVHQGVPLFGKPDCFFINGEGAFVILDWKVNNYCAKSGGSPLPGYKMCRDCWGSTDGIKMSRNNWLGHERYTGGMFKGIEINLQLNLEDVSKDWAIQLATYGWLHGSPVGVECITAIDQIVGQRPKIRVAQHRTKVSAAFQHETMAQYSDLWDRIVSGHFFRDETKEQSDAHCALLDKQSALLYGPNTTEEDKVFAGLTGGHGQYRPR